MKPDLQRLDAAAKALKHLRAAQVDYERKSDRARDNSSWARVARLSTDMCEPKDAAAYAQRAQHLSGFHDVAYQPAVPATIQDSLIVGAHKEQS
ncbi:hypothetical protein [Achromobacter sp. AONIH1]|uniref:hypothetical protein n=1 Tax=Achromobacter sp. AONIH1 TaxID=1758194 RepID=UPI000CD047C2|nr:hypothetical protein [Achromobacter sp. AONIH1]AUT46972.1 hypothetical protein C2U31_13810 [Achromobacter sp. AONIH1]